MVIDPTEDGVARGIVRLASELGQLKLERRNGWKHIHEDPGSVAEHTCRAASLGFLLASLAREREPAYAGVEPHYVCTLITFHDMHEARTGDDDLVQKQYTKIDRRAAVEDQVAGLGAIGAAVKAMWLEVEERSTPAGILAKDADLLEEAFAGRELLARGNREAQAWIDAAGDRLTSQTAKELLRILEEADPYEWWKRLLGYPLTSAELKSPPIP